MENRKLFLSTWGRSRKLNHLLWARTLQGFSSARKERVCRILNMKAQHSPVPSCGSLIVRIIWLLASGDTDKILEPAMYILNRLPSQYARKTECLSLLEIILKQQVNKASFAQYALQNSFKSKDNKIMCVFILTPYGIFTVWHPNL